MLFGATSWSSLHSLASWLTYELSATYTCDKNYQKDFKKLVPPDLEPYTRHFRRPIWLAKEERTILSTFIAFVFDDYLENGNAKDLDALKVLGDVTQRVGLPGYARNTYLKMLCIEVVNKLSDLFAPVRTSEGFDCMFILNADNSFSSNELGRRFFIIKKSRNQKDFEQWYYTKPKTSRKFIWDYYIIAEEWNTPQSKGDTGDFSDFAFDTYMDASQFLMRLILKLNSPNANALWAAGEKVATEITRTCQRKRCLLNNVKANSPKFDRQFKNNSLVEQPQTSTRVYLLGRADGVIKFGITTNFESRFRSLRASGGIDFTRWCYTAKYTPKDAARIEAFLLTKTLGYSVDTVGEFRRMDYDDAKALLLSQASIEREEILKPRSN